MIAWLVRGILAGEALLAIACAHLFSGPLGCPAWVALLAALATPVVLHATAIGLQMATAAWYRTRTDRTRTEARTAGPAPTGGLRMALRAWVGETLASLHSFVLLLPWFGNRPLPSGADPGRIPVLLVHGYFCNRAVWRPMARWLARRGHAVASVNLEPPFSAIDTGVPTLEAAVEALRARTGAARVALCGHSMGGLVIRAWMARHGHQRVAMAITLGSPHQGTWSARFALGGNVAQMRPGSDWLARLARTEAPAARERFTVIITLHDNIVVPPAEQTLPGARHHVLSGIGHMALVNAEPVRELVAEALDLAGAGPGRTDDDPPAAGATR